MTPEPYDAMSYIALSNDSDPIYAIDGFALYNILWYRDTCWGETVRGEGCRRKRPEEWRGYVWYCTYHRDIELARETVYLP